MKNISPQRHRDTEKTQYTLNGKIGLNCSEIQRQENKKLLSLILFFSVPLCLCGGF